MKIAVILRQVPDLVEPLEVDDSGTALDFEEASFLANETDEHALEQAILLKESGGAEVTVVDPEGRREGEKLLPGVVWEEDAYRAAEDADLVVILTEWNAFRALDLKRVAGAMRTPRLADFRNIYSAEDAREAGFEAYAAVGRAEYGID